MLLLLFVLLIVAAAFPPGGVFVGANALYPSFIQPLSGGATTTLFPSSTANNNDDENIDARNSGRHLERGKILTSPFDAEALYDAYRDIQVDYERKAFRNDDERDEKWRILNQRDGAEVSILHHPSDPTCPYVKMRATMPVPVQHCWNFLRIPEWDRTMPKMDPFYEGVSIHGQYGHAGVHMLLCRKRTKRILTFGKRDLVFLSVTQDDPLDDGSWASGTVSVCTDLIPRQRGYTRAFQDSIAFYKPMDDNTKTNLTIVCRIDLNDSGQDGEGGFIPMWLYVKTIGITAMQSVTRMRKALIDEQREQQIAGSYYDNNNTYSDTAPILAP